MFAFGVLIILGIRFQDARSKAATLGIIPNRWHLPTWSAMD
jgi:hypothetical protein